MTEVIDTNTIEQKNGSTTARGAYTILREDDGDVQILTEFWVKKTGISGTGHGVMVFALLNAEGERIFNVNPGFSVGADALDGVNKKEVKDSTTLFKNFFDKNVAGVVFTVQADKDTIGVPKTPEDWKILLGTAVPIIFGGLDVGAAKAIAGWVIRKLK